MRLFQKNYLPQIILFLLAILLYANTLGHEFVLDDDVVLVRNVFVNQGFAGIPAIFSNDAFAGFERLAGQENLLAGGRYRPLSLAFFAVLREAFGANPAAFHACSILLYGWCGWVVFGLVKLMLKGNGDAGKLAFLTALIFVVHPVHSEVVANVKSCDEQLALLLGLSAVFAVFKTFDTGGKSWWAAAAALFFAACLAKENAVTLAVATPLALLFFRNANLAAALKNSLPLFISLAAFLALRAAVVGTPDAGGQWMNDPLNNPFLTWNGNAWQPAGASEIIATLFLTFGKYVRLLVLPYSLTHDYYPFHIRLENFGSPWVWASILAFLAALGYAIWGIWKRLFPTINRKPASAYYASFGVLFFLLTLLITLNIFFPVGTFMAERFLFLPSFGFCLAVIFWGNRFGEKYNRLTFLIAMGIIAVLFSAITILRNPAWKNNETLLRTDLNQSPNSAKLRGSLGIILLENALKMQDATQRKPLLQESWTHLNAALELHPTYYDALLAHGACSYYLGKYSESVSAYRTAYQISPGDGKSKLGLKYALQAYADNLSKNGQNMEAISAMTQAWELQPDTLSAAHLARFYKAENQPDKAEEWRKKASEF